MKKTSIIIVIILVILITCGYFIYKAVYPIYKVYKSLTNYSMILPNIPTNINQALHQVENVANALTTHQVKPDSSVNVPKTKSVISEIDYQSNYDLWVTKDGKKQRYSSVYAPFKVDSSGVKTSRVAFEITTGLLYKSQTDSISGKLPKPTIMVDIKLPKKMRVNAQLSTPYKIENYTSLKKFGRSIDWGIFIGYRW